MREAALIESTNAKGYTFSRVIRGKLHEKDKHWGMRSNMKFREILEAKKNENKQKDL